MAAGPQKHTKEIFQGPGGEWRLTTAEKKRILLSNIYGVDIDSQAVETTKLSLLLKVLEGETQETINAQLSFLRERALPDLANNIKCGNSLIGPDFYDNQQLGLLGDEERYRINVFDWEAEFPQILGKAIPEARRGFDAVIGNPPYVGVDQTWGRGDQRLAYLKRCYSEVYNDKTDLLFYFLARSLMLARGAVGVIVSRAFLEAYKADKLRGWLSKQAGVREIVDFQNFHVFAGVGIATAILVLDRGGTPALSRIRRLRGASFERDAFLAGQPTDSFLSLEVAQESFGSGPWSFSDEAIEHVCQIVDAAGDPVGDVLTIGQGMQTGRNEVFAGLSQTWIDSSGLERGQHFARAHNSDILAFGVSDRGDRVLYLEDFRTFEELPQMVRQHLKAHEEELKSRAAFVRGNCEWWKYTWPLHKEMKGRPRLYCPYLATANRFALDLECRFLGLTDTTVLYEAGQAEDLRYLLALLNSSLFTLRFRQIGKLKGSGVYEYFWNSVSKLRVRRIDFQSLGDRTYHDALSTLASSAEVAVASVMTARTTHEKDLHHRAVAAATREIDRLVYELYGLSESEIVIVESSLRG